MLKNKIRRYKMMDAHRNLVKTGKLPEARLILRLLRNGIITLDLSDTDWNVETICEKLDCQITYSRNGYTSTVFLPKSK